MVKILRITTIFILGIEILWSQKILTNNDIWKGEFRTNHLDEIHVLAKQNKYTVLDYSPKSNSMQINVFEFLTQKKINTLLDTKNFKALKYIDKYWFSKDETKILIATNTKRIYRHSFSANYFVFELETKKLTPIFDYPIQEATFNPKGDKVAFVYKNNLYFSDLTTKKVKQLTFDGKKNEIINGIADWVYEEEFSFVKAFKWNTSGNKIAYLSFDEKEVPNFSMNYYNKGLYPNQYIFKYPKAGENNSIVELHIYSIENEKNQTIDLNLNKNNYIPRIQWTKNSEILSVQVLNRLQNQLDLYFINAKEGIHKRILQEKDKTYVEINDNLTFLEDNSFIWTSEQNGFNHLYHYNEKGLINQITNGPWEVTKFYGYNKKTKRLFYQSTKEHSTQRDIYSINLNGAKEKKLTNLSGTHDAIFNYNYSYFIDYFSSEKIAPQYSLINVKKIKKIKTILDNKSLENQIEKYDLPKKEFFEIKNQTNDLLNAWIIKPTDFDPNKKYPLLMFQYSGPGSQEVSKSWHSYNDYWHYLLAQKGVIVLCVDGRGTGYKGALFKKCTYKNLGKLEVEDQIYIAKKFANKPYIDQNRIGIWGWSYGGFMSSNCILKGNDVFKLAIAVAPVTSWRYYDTVYTERYLQTPKQNPKGYDDNSPINFVDQLKGKFLLVHGTGDDNVHVQNSMKMIEALVQANKPFDLAIYPDKNHGIYGGNTRIHLFNKMTDYILNQL